MITVQANRDLAAPALGTGTEWVVDASGCDVQRLCDLDLIKGICDRVVADIGVTVVGVPQYHRFEGPGGITMLYMLSESHLACHTYPEYGLATFNLYCCRARAAWHWEEILRDVLGSHAVSVRQLARGVSPNSGGSMAVDSNVMSSHSSKLSGRGQV
jgi:S-adenosylmethionine decarboxylase